MTVKYKVIISLLFSFSTVVCRNNSQQKNDNYTVNGYYCFDSNFILNVTIANDDNIGDVVNEDDIVQENATMQLIQLKATNEVIIHEIRIMRDIFVDQCGFTNWMGKLGRFLNYQLNEGKDFYQMTNYRYLNKNLPTSI